MTLDESLEEARAIGNAQTKVLQRFADIYTTQHEVIVLILIFVKCDWFHRLYFSFSSLYFSSYEHTPYSAYNLAKSLIRAFTTNLQWHRIAVSRRFVSSASISLMICLIYLECLFFSRLRAACQWFCLHIFRQKQCRQD